MSLNSLRTRKFALAAAFAGTLSMAGCNTVDRDNAVIGGAAGAVIGGVATGTLEGAAVGGAIGAGAGVLLGRVAAGSNQCYYRNRWGGRYIARCR